MNSLKMDIFYIKYGLGLRTKIAFLVHLIMTANTIIVFNGSLLLLILSPVIAYLISIKFDSAGEPLIFSRGSQGDQSDNQWDPRVFKPEYGPQSPSLPDNSDIINRNSWLSGGGCDGG